MADGKRKHFGVLCSTIDIANQYDALKGIVEVTAENDIHLTAFIGTYQTTDNHFYSYLESCFDTMFGGESVPDGLIVMSGFVAQNVGLEEFDRYIARLPGSIPAVSVSFEVQGIPSVVTYNKSGMYSAVDHLIRMHGKRHIAFIKGPDGHPEAEARLQGYREAMEANGLEFDRNYLFDGDFGRETGRVAVNELYDTRKIPVDAFACCNDQSAVGVMHCLKKRNVMVPGSVAVVGFDNDIISSIHVPAIGTVGQDFVQLGRESARVLLEQVNGRHVDDVTRVVPKFIPRQSCGCLGMESVHNIHDTGEHVGGMSFRDYVETRFIELLECDVPHAQIKTWVETLLGKICSEPFCRDEFLTALDRMLVTFYHSYSTEFAPWHKALIVLAAGLEKYGTGLQSCHTILSTLTYATTLVYDIRMSEEKKKEYTQNDDRMRRRRNTNALLLMFDVEALAEELCKSISELSMNTALIGIFGNPVKRGEQNCDRAIKTVIGFDGKDRFYVQFDSHSQIRLSDFHAIRGFDYDRERRTLFFQPLFFMEEEVGVMLLPYDPLITTDTYETLRINISTTLKGAQLMSTIQTLSVTDELTGLYNRRGFFQFTYSRLNHLLRNDDIASLVVFLDMDGLKQINDNYGHNEGDIAIKAFAGVIKKTMREEDIIGRIGGDEFAILSSVRSFKNAKQLEVRLREAFSEYNAKGLHPYRVDASIGCVVLEEASRECFDKAMLSADGVLYEEKAAKKVNRELETGATGAAGAAGTAGATGATGIRIRD